MKSDASSLRRLHVIFKTHLDIGFTDLASQVQAKYFHCFIPKAIELARELRAKNGASKFIWTTGSWLIYEYLETFKGAKRRLLEQAIVEGDIVWHGLPFTTHTELLDSSLFRFGLGYAKKLDARFGRKTIAAKMTDVPGHTRAMVPLLAEAGIRFLHIGVNPASTAPDVPGAFRWQAPDRSETLVVYNKGDYGGLIRLNGFSDVLYFAHTGDNNGPPSVSSVEETFRKLKKRFPGYVIAASTLDHYAARLQRIGATLPVITKELGDTWIHGAGSDPLKVSQYRALLRWRAGLSARKSESKAMRNFSRKLILIPEHTWGMDIKIGLDWFGRFNSRFRKKDFLQDRNRPDFRKMEKSWKEQRRYISSAIQELKGTPLHRAANRVLRGLRSGKKSHGASIAPGQVQETPEFEIAFSPETGAISHLHQRSNGKVWASAKNPMALPWYEIFSAGDYQSFWNHYNQHHDKVRSWAVPDFMKPGLEMVVHRHRKWKPRLEVLSNFQQKRRHCFLVESFFDKQAVRHYGCPEKIQILVALSSDRPLLQLEVQWFGKQASRIPEAFWLSMTPPCCPGNQWSLQKMDDPINPLSVVRNGARALHAVEQCSCRDDKGSMIIRNFDSPLVAPGKPSLVHFSNRLPDPRRGVHFNLYNNAWGTNFPLWYEEDASFRFELEFEP